MSIIQCDNLSKQYGNKLALDTVSLTLTQGAPIALVGPNGAGKTTLFSLLCGFIQPTNGSISILGHKPGSKALQGLLSALPQDAALDPNFSIVSQLQFFAQLQGMTAAAAKQEALRVLALVDLSDSAEAKPKSLSHGMSKRVSIAQALMGSPKIVLLDEPTAGLDPANAKKIRQIVKDLSDHTTFVISSHNLDELEKLCDQVVYLEHGKLQQSVSIKASQATDFITLTMKQCDMDSLHQQLLGLNDIIEVRRIGDEQYVIEYQKQSGFAIEMQLFELFTAHQWQYKALLKGRTLEETLFS
ncbi:MULTISPECIES: ABC transporter ATP-binding protein [unclassified Shewanella]|jgi:ABC-type multidrug transport system ATPase subunit|uniref:ABC transporter ATP-binding protein n=1 Tax=unclassified Shewanella TaxID=196818 RepID=UPI000C3224AA|nr:MULTISPECIES: ABC transporter ATP-binding protein [unclassified Shewanella]MBB1361515.1 ABC transporter ATP-binding protein [Shewanella sp. SR44-4]MBO1898320.1 ABC transporter ATP-binding protein [Shewanella sp. BF02_Schw]PKH29960.1 ABC transporter ATP-binding protein [Shewanella sp. ALD9]QHS13212.1 ABC transporter ATP-binding protein [Shewanella sp. Arc9-LZ]